MAQMPNAFKFHYRLKEHSIPYKYEECIQEIFAQL